MVTTILFGMVFALSLVLATVYGYYLGVRNTTDYFSMLLKKQNPTVSKAVKKFDDETRGDWDNKTYN